MIRVRLMTAQDLALGMRLKGQAGWNQTEADWRRVLALQPDGCFVAELDGVPVGTTVTCIFDAVAWVAMVLVDPARRGQGVGTALMRHALAFLDERKVQTVRLDATPLGRPIYEKLGFVAQYQLTRYEGIPSATAREGAGAVEPLSSEQAPALLELDRAVTRTNRSKFLLRLLEENPDAARVVRRAGRSAGYIMARPGARAVMIGPCIADAAAGPLLFADAWQRYSGQAVFVDIPVANTAATRSAEAQALTVQRPLLRMCRGEMVEERIEELWASSGPELG